MLNVSIVLVTYLTFRDPLLTVACYALSFTCYQLVYLVAVYRVAGFDMALLMRVLCAGASEVRRRRCNGRRGRWLLPTQPALAISAVVALVATLVLIG